MKAENIYFIVNPTSAAGKCAERFEEAYAYLRENGVSGTVLKTEYAGHGHELTKQAVSEGADCVVIVGGDGSIREAGAVLAKTEIPLCIFPFGSANDFASALKLPEAPKEAAEQLISGKIRPIDAAEVNGEVFMNVAGFGFDVEVLVQTENFKKRMGDKTAYIFGLIKALAHLKAKRVRFEHGGKAYDLDAFIVTVGNGKFIGGGMEAHPQADAEDGLLEICVIKHVSKLKVPALLLKFMKGKHLDLPDTIYFRTDEIFVECGEESIVQLDGELIGKTPARFKVLPSAIKLIAKGD